MNYNEMKAILQQDEPDYNQFKSVTVGSVDDLEKLLLYHDDAISSKAAYALTVVDPKLVRQLLISASQDKRVLVRVAVASGLANAKRDRRYETQLINMLLDDEDFGVLKWAIIAAGFYTDDPSVGDKLKLLKASKVDSAYLRSLINETMDMDLD